MYVLQIYVKCEQIKPESTVIYPSVEQENQTFKLNKKD